MAISLGIYPTFSDKPNSLHPSHSPAPPGPPWHLVMCICSCRSMARVTRPARSKMLAASCIKRTGQALSINLLAMCGITSSKLCSTPSLESDSKKMEVKESEVPKGRILKPYLNKGALVSAVVNTAAAI